MKMNLQHSTLPLELAASASADGSWIMIFPAGRQAGVDGRGPYVLEDMEAVIAASLRPQVDLAIDRDHQMDILPPGAEKPAAGWIKELQARADGIWARVEWTPRAKEQIDQKEYRYISPVFYHDRANGRVKKILRASLVNNPNLEVKAVAAAEADINQENDMELIAKLAVLLGLAEGSSEDSVLEAIKALKTTDEKVKEAVDAPAEATGDEVVEQLEKKIEEQVTAETASRLDKVKAELAAAGADPSKFVPIAAFNEMKDQVKALASAEKSRTAEAKVEEAMRAGKVSPALKTWALALASSNPAEFDAFVKDAPVIVKAGATGKTELPETASALSDEDKALCSQLGITAEEFVASAKKKQA